MNQDRQKVYRTPRLIYTVREFWYGGLWRIKYTVVTNDPCNSVLVHYFDHSYFFKQLADARYETLAWFLCRFVQEPEPVPEPEIIIGCW